jgi:hypothetical protein
MVTKALVLGLEEDSSRKVQALITHNVMGSDILLPLLRAAADAKEQLAILEILARKQHRTFNIKELIPRPKNKVSNSRTAPSRRRVSSAARRA